MKALARARERADAFARSLARSHARTLGTMHFIYTGFDGNPSIPFEIKSNCKILYILFSSKSI